MIKYNPKSWFLFKGSLIKKLFVGMVLTTLLTALLCLLHIKFGYINIKWSGVLPGYMGVALGLLLIFRNNSAYDKWWEARKEWGALVNLSRNIALTLYSLFPEGTKEINACYKLLIGFPYALKEHLRKGVKIAELREIENNDLELIKTVTHKPNMIIKLLLLKINKLHKENQITNQQNTLLIHNINGLTDVLGKCERIRNTPIPIAYAFLLKFFIVMYVVILPIGLLHDLGWWTVFLVAILYYILMSIVLIAEEIEEPFGHDMNDLSTDEMAQNIECNIKEIYNSKEA